MIAGIDLSSKAIHIVTLAEDTNDAVAHAVRLDAHRGDATTRIRRLRDLMPARGAWPDLGVTLMALERPIALHSSVPLMVYGALLQLIPPAMPILELRADDWRKECCLPLRGARSDLKAASVRFARHVWEGAPYALDDDTADAFCISFAAREIQLRTEVAA